MMPSMEVSRFHTYSQIHNGSTAATKLPRADAAAVTPCCYRVLAAASVMGRLLLARTSQNSVLAKFAFWGFCEVRRIPIPRTPVNRGKQKRKDRRGARSAPLRYHA